MSGELWIDERGAGEFQKLLDLPGNLTDVSSMVATAMSVIKQKGGPLTQAAAMHE